jgi:hypothetical protein
MDFLGILRDREKQKQKRLKLKQSTDADDFLQLMSQHLDSQVREASKSVAQSESGSVTSNSKKPFWLQKKKEGANPEEAATGEEQSLA